jgi:hypothetical protein
MERKITKLKNQLISEYQYENASFARDIEKEVPFVDEVEEFNITMGKGWQNRTEPTIDKKDAQFVVDFIQEELDEMKEAIEQDDIVRYSRCNFRYYICWFRKWRFSLWPQRQNPPRIC